MKVSTRFFCMAIVVLALGLFATAIRVQAQSYPPCNTGGITIQNTSGVPVTICIKTVACYDIPAFTSQFFPLPVGTEIPGLYGVASVTYEWEPTGLITPALWIPGLALLPTGRCFDVYFDQPSCTIRVVLVGAPPCLHP